MKEKPQLSTGDYVSLLYVMTRAVGAASWASMTGWSRGEEYPKEYNRHVVYSTFRTVFPLLSVHQMQAVQETTVEAYQSFTKKNKIPPETVELQEDAVGCFLGPKTAKKTLLWFHGGGYAFAASTQHYQMLWDLIKLAEKNGSELRAMVLAYELAPHASYPTQLKQAVAAVNYLLGSGLQPSQILIGGDSAGGNLSAALLSHLAHPNPSVPAVSVSGNLGGALLLSPWVTFDQDAESFRRNYKKDALDPSTMNLWSTNFLGGSPRDNYNQPKDAPPEWWRSLKANEVLVIGAANEIIVDDIKALAEKMKVHNPHVEYLEAPGESHDALVMDKTMGINVELASEQFVNRWILARLNSS